MLTEPKDGGMNQSDKTREGGSPTVCVRKKSNGKKQRRVYIWIHVHCLEFIIAISTKWKYKIRPRERRRCKNETK